MPQNLQEQHPHRVLGLPLALWDEATQFPGEFVELTLEMMTLINFATVLRVRGRMLALSVSVCVVGRSQRC